MSCLVTHTGQSCAVSTSYLVKAYPIKNLDMTEKQTFFSKAFQRSTCFTALHLCRWQQSISEFARGGLGCLAAGPSRVTVNLAAVATGCHSCCRCCCCCLSWATALFIQTQTQTQGGPKRNTQPQVAISVVSHIPVGDARTVYPLKDSECICLVLSWWLSPCSPSFIVSPFMSLFSLRLFLRASHDGRFCALGF